MQSNSMDLFAILIVLVLGVIGILTFAFWVWMIIDCAKNKGLSDGERIVWILVIIFVQVIGTVIYFFVGRPRNREHAPPG